MAYIDFPDGLKGQKERKRFWLSADGLMLIRNWRRQGIPLTTIATEYIGVSKTGFFGWYRESDELYRACATSRDITNTAVEEALLKRALGYDYIEQTYDLIEGHLVLAHEYHRHMPPDTKAILSWLYNHMPTQYRSIQEPLENTQYIETVKNILVAMQEVAADGKPKYIEANNAASESNENTENTSPLHENGSSLG